MIRLFTLASALAFLAACDTSLEPIDAGSSKTWATATPEEVGLDPEKLNAVWEYAFGESMNTLGVVIVKDGYLVAEKYGPDYDRDSWATSWSVGKSFTSAMLGIAWTDGLLTDLNHSMARYYPEWEGTEYEKITLRDVLTMSSGLQWNERYAVDDDSGTSDVAILVLEEEPLDVVMSRPITAPPATKFNYSSGDTMLLSQVVEQLTGSNPTALAKERLAKPLNFSKLHWWEDAVDNTFTFCCVDTTVRDFAKFGQLYLQRGKWNNEQLIAEEWVHMTTAETSLAYGGYGLQWWLNSGDEGKEYPSLPANAYFALGHDVQLVGVFPDENMVIARNGKYVKPEGTGKTEIGLFPGGLWSDGGGPTGSTPPEGDWSDDKFFSLILEAIVPDE